MQKRLIKWCAWIGGLIILLLAVSLFSLSVGSADISPAKVFPLIFAQKESIQTTILLSIRLPRIILALIVGGSLAVAGVIFQGMFRNPLVEPYTLGVSGGAALGVALVSILKLALIKPLAGFIGAMGSIFLVYFLTGRKSHLRISTLLLTGVMISFISSSLIMLIMAISRTEDIHGILFWIMGSLEAASWPMIKIVFFATFLGVLVSLFLTQDLNALSLGEEEALHLGINIEKVKKILFIIASLLSGCAVAVSGIIGFVGLVTPHFMRMLVGSDHRILLIVSFLAGATFLLLCDTLARTIIAPMELPVGVITGILGGSLFVYALSKRQILH